MSVNSEKKENVVRELAKNFEKHDTFYLLDFINMPVYQAVELRRKMREHSFLFRVVKNRLALRALTDDLPEDLRPHFRGPTAIAFASENPLKLAHLLRDFFAQYKVLKYKGGILEGQFLPEDQFGEVARLSSRDELLAKIGYLMANPLIKLLRTWQAPMENLGSLLSQLKSKK